MKPTLFAEMAVKAVENWEAKNGSVSSFVKSTEQLRKHFDPSYKGARVPFKELMTAPDFGGLFHRVITDQLQMPIEPQYLGVSMFSRTIQMEPNTVARFPIMGAVTASDVANNMPIPRQDIGFTHQVMGVDAIRAGIAFDLDPEFLDDSAYNIFGFLVEAGKRALVRHKEKKVWDAALDNAHIMFDNSSADSNAWTGGRGADAVTQNGSFAYENFVDMMAGLQVNDYTPTDILGNPLAYAILYKDPILRAQFFGGGPVSTNYSKGVDLTAAGPQSMLPWGVQYHISRFMPIHFNHTINGGMPAATGAANVTDLLMFDRSNQVLIVERQGMQLKQWEQSPEIELRSIAMEEKYAVYGLDMGRSAVKAKNIRLVDNHQALYNIGHVTL